MFVILYTSPCSSSYILHFRFLLPSNHDAYKPTFSQSSACLKKRLAPAPPGKPLLRVLLHRGLAWGEPITARVIRNDRTAGLAYLQLKGGGLGFQMVHLWPPNSLMRRRTGSSKLTARNHGVNFLAVPVVRNSEKYGLISLPMGISVRK